MGLYIDMEYVDVPEMYMCLKYGFTYTSQINHFIVSNNVCNNVVECFINDDLFQTMQL